MPFKNLSRGILEVEASDDEATKESHYALDNAETQVLTEDSMQAIAESPAAPPPQIPSKAAKPAKQACDPTKFQIQDD